MIRLATEEDLPAIYSLGFENYSKKALEAYSTIVDDEKVKQAVKEITKKNTVYVADINDNIVGCIVGVIVPCIFSKDIMYSSIFFFISETFRRITKSFINELEEILREQKITRLIIGNPELNNGPEMDRYYQMLGFRKLETHYLRIIEQS